MAGLDKIVTDEAVFEIADRLTADGQKVTNRVIWDQIGGGSMTTIAAALRRWRDQQQLKPALPVERPALPDVVAETMREAVDQLWKSALAATQGELDALTQQMNQRVAEAVASREEALTDLGEAQEERDQLRAELAEQGAALAQAQASLEAQTVQLTGLLTDNQTLRADGEKAVIRLAEIEHRAEDLKSELNRLHADVEAERQRHADELSSAQDATERLRAELERLRKSSTAEADQLRVELATTKARAEAAEQQHANQLKQLGLDAERVAERAAKAEEAREVARKEAGEAREDAAKLRGHVEAIESQRAELVKVLAERRVTVVKDGKPAAGKGAK